MCWDISVSCNLSTWVSDLHAVSHGSVSPRCNSQVVTRAESFLMCPILYAVTVGLMIDIRPQSRSVLPQIADSGEHTIQAEHSPSRPSHLSTVRRNRHDTVVCDSLIFPDTVAICHTACQSQRGDDDLDTREQMPPFSETSPPSPLNLLAEIHHRASEPFFFTTTPRAYEPTHIRTLYQSVENMIKQGLRGQHHRGRASKFLSINIFSLF